MGSVQTGQLANTHDWRTHQRDAESVWEKDLLQRNFLECFQIMDITVADAGQTFQEQIIAVL
jgi:hypothetical protein